MPAERQSDLAQLRERLAGLQLPQIGFRRRAIIIFEGLDGSGKKHALKQLAAAFDPCHYAVHSVERERREAADGHWLARFWRALPAAGHSSIFYRSWYRRALDERVLLARAMPAFEQDDGALAMDDLRPLEHAQPLLQREQLGRPFPGERNPPFKLR